MDGDMIVPTSTGTTVFNKEAVALIKSQIAPDLNDMELQLFLWNAQRMGLDPLARQMYAVKRAGRMTLQIGIDGFRVVANRNGLAGIEEAVHDDENAPFPKWSKVTVYRFINGERVPFTATARWSEYAVTNNAMWKKMPYLMLDKCAEALALRKGFPNELSGVYTTDEMMQAGDKGLEPEKTPEQFDEEMYAYKFKFANGSEVSVSDLITRPNANEMFTKMLPYAKDELQKKYLERALQIVNDKPKDVTDDDADLYRGTPMEASGNG